MMTMGFAVAGCWRERRVGSDAVCSCAVARARGAGDARTRRARARAVKMRVGDTAAALVSDAVLVKGSTRDGFRSREATTRRRAPLYDTRRVLYIRALRRHKGGVYTNVFAVCARVVVLLVFLCARSCRTSYSWNPRRRQRSRGESRVLIHRFRATEPFRAGDEP
jgi:hypothetical protein